MASFFTAPVKASIGSPSSFSSGGGGSFSPSSGLRLGGMFNVSVNQEVNNDLKEIYQTVEEYKGEKFKWQNLSG